MIFKSKIFRRFLIVYLPVILAPLIIIACIALWYGRVEIRDQTFRQLQIMADGAEAQVLDYLNYLKIQTSGYSTSKPLIDALKKRYRHTGNNNSDRVLNRYLAAGINNFPECVEMFVLDVNGRVIASSDASNTGKDHSETDYFFNGRKTVYISNIFREEETGRITWLVSCPVMDVRSNKLLAVLVSRINPVTLSDITTERKVRALGAKSQSSRTGETGETYIVNRDNLMITESRFLDDVILKQAVDTEIVRCTRKVGETNAANYPGYRGVPVDGASMIIWETGWIIILEKDYKESVIPFQRLLHLNLTGIGVLIPLIFFSSWLLSRRLIRPIMRLVQADREMIQGDLSRTFISDHEMPADELGEVMRSRNKMLNNIKEREETLKRQAQMLDLASDAIIIRDFDDRITYWNHAAELQYGWTAIEAASQYPNELLNTVFQIPEDEITAILFRNGLWEGDVAQTRRNGAQLTVWSRYQLLKDEEDRITGLLEINRDITEKKKAEETIRNLSLTDEFTKLYNRRGFMTFARQALKIAERTKSAVTIFFADIDGLKWINDNMGHDHGDMAILDAANMLRSAFRESDIIARLGGDEFAVVSMGDGSFNASTLASRLQKNIEAHNTNGNRPFLLSMSVGMVRRSLTQPKSIDDLLKEADKLMYDQKRKKKENIKTVAYRKVGADSCRRMGIPDGV